MRLIGKCDVFLTLIIWWTINGDGRMIGDQFEMYRWMTDGVVCSLGVSSGTLSWLDLMGKCWMDLK